MKTAHQRWQERTDDGKRMPGGWSSAKHTPTKRGQYEVRGHPDHRLLTWAYGHWWRMRHNGLGSVPYWHLVKGTYSWRDGGHGDNTCIHGADLLLKAVELGSQEAEAELRAMGWKGDYRPYAKDASWRDA